MGVRPNLPLQSKLFPQPGGREALMAVGFEEHQGEGQVVFLMSDPPPKTVGEVKTMLDAAVEALKAQ